MCKAHRSRQGGQNPIKRLELFLCAMPYELKQHFPLSGMQGIIIIIKQH